MKITEAAHIFCSSFPSLKLCRYKFGQGLGWATIWAILSQTHLVTLCIADIFVIGRIFSEIFRPMIWNLNVIPVGKILNE
jgi:hypothetical protein